MWSLGKVLNTPEVMRVYIGQVISTSFSFPLFWFKQINFDSQSKSNTNESSFVMNSKGSSMFVEINVMCKLLYFYWQENTFSIMHVCFFQS